MIIDKVHIKEIIGGRYDNSYVLYHHRLSTYKYPTEPLHKFLVGKPQYGSGEAGIPRENYDSPRYIRITDIDENGFLIDDIGVTAKNVEEKYILRNNDILIARSGNTVGKSYIHKTKFVNGTCFFAGYLIRFIIDSSIIIPDYVYVFTKLPVFYNWIKVTQRVVGQPNINAEEYSCLPVPVPPAQIQQEIINIFLRAQKARLDKIQEAKQILNSIDDYLFDILHIGKLSNNRKRKVALKQKVSSIIGGRFDPMQFHYERIEIVNRIKQGNWCRLKDVVNNVKTIISSLSQDNVYIGMENIDGSSGDYCPSKEKESISSAAKFKNGDILFPKLRPYLNKVYRAQFDGCCSTEFHVFEAHDINPDFLTIVLRSNLILAQTTHLMTGNTLPRLQTIDIDNLIIPYPDITIQEDIVNSVSAIKNKAKKLKEEGDVLLDEAKQKIEQLILE